jgi:SPW repeat
VKPLKHWQDGVNALIGLLVVLSPWVLGFQADLAVTSNAVLVGLALIAAAMGAMLVPRAWEEWTEAVIGLWLMASPFVLGFSARRELMLGAVITGSVVFVLCLWTLLTDKEYRSWLNDETAAH